MRIHISEVQIGDQLLANVFNQYGLHVLPVEKVLDAEDIGKLSRHNIEYVDIQRRTHNVASASDNHKLAQIAEIVQPRYNEAVEGMQELFQIALSEGKISDEHVEKSFHPLVESFKQEIDVVTLLLTLNGKDDYTFHHSVQVGMIAYYLAKWSGYDDKEALFIGKTGYLHDIGKSMIDSSILKKPSSLTEGEFNIIKNHTLLGHKIIVSSQMPEEVALVALQHHERINGTGYPNGIKGSDMHPMSKLVAVVDVYSAMISSRVYQKKRDLLIVLKELYRLSFSELDPILTHTFIGNMVPNFIGKKIALKSGEIGYIVMTNPSDFFKPLIQIDDRFIDLSRNPDLEIETVYL